MSNQIILQPDKYRQWQRYGGGAAQVVEDWQEAIYTEPTRSATRESDVIVPFSQAVISGLFASGAVLLGVQFAGYYWAIPWGGWERLSGAALLGLLVAWVKWRGLLADTRELLRRVETFARDLADDGRLNDSVVSSEPITIRVDTRRPGGSQTMFSRLPVTDAQMRQFARRALDGRSMGIGAMTGNGQPFSRGEYEELTAFLASAGILRWVNPDAKNQGRELTRAGRAAMESFVGGE